MSDEADPPTRAILAAIANLRKEVTQSKNDICASIEARLLICTELREELATTKKEIQSSIKTLEAATAAHEKTIKELERSRRHNIRIVGVPEGVEGSTTRDFVADLLKDVLSLDEKPLIDRVHRTLRRSPGPRGPPRPFILRLHYYHVLEDILRKARVAKQLYFRDKRIQIFPDYPPAVAQRRALFNRARELLRNKPGVRYGLLYPARLLVTHNGTQTSFTDPKKAEEYAEQLSGPGSPTAAVD
ncbi:hypothetical protein D5F01_LYC05641 [Larimichthys crocea]|uniref:Transposase element L1Md-A101/L1Md-A102/L1Md-A2 n=1 Tax=Larimichthys crocea TaxID=215358 RepID=A0A6G0J000_LARCR|nr:hypothetical protein D5F01_LYC05641 [Larimichthys crocea]